MPKVDRPNYNPDHSPTMPRRRLTMTTRAVLLAAAAVALAVPAALPRDPVSVAASVIPPPLVADPFPIRRTFLTGERLAAVLADAARGNLARLPREEFEAKVRAASRHAADPSPRLAEACYKATLTDVGLTGSAEWRVAGSGLLALDPLRPAVSGPKWADGSPAAIVRAEPPGKIAGAFLVLDRTGDNTVSLNWSSRGAEEPGVERFDLAFPPAPVATLELDLPADRVRPRQPAGQPHLRARPWPRRRQRREPRHRHPADGRRVGAGHDHPRRLARLDSPAEPPRPGHAGDAQPRVHLQRQLVRLTADRRQFQLDGTGREPRGQLVPGGAVDADHRPRLAGPVRPADGKVHARPAAGKDSRGVPRPRPNR